MAKKKNKKTDCPKMVVESSIDPEVRNLMRKLGLTEEEAIYMMEHDCLAQPLAGAERAH